MLFAQTVGAAVAADAGVAETAEVRPAAPGERGGEGDRRDTPNEPTPALPQPAAPRALPRDATTGQLVVPRDETGQPLVLRDATGQPLRTTDETGQEDVQEPSFFAADSFLRPLGPGGSLLVGGAPDEEGGAPTPPGGTDYHLQLALVEGYNSNVIQTQAALNGPVTRHPSPFTGIDVIGEMRTWTSPYDAQDFRIQVRGQHYTPLDGYSQPDDGSINAAWGGQLTLAPRTALTGRVISTLSSVNSSRLSDGPLFLVDPSNLQRVYTLTSARFAVVHELSPRWRFVQGADVDVSTTVRDTPVQRADGTPFRHRGLDYVQPGIDSSLAHDVDEQNILSVRGRYQPTYIAFLLNYSSNPPGAIGSAWTHQVEGDVGWMHAFTDRFRALTSVGALVATAPPLDADRRPIISPVLSEEIVYQRQFWLAALTGNYTYGSASPRLGFGPSVGGGFTAEGTPFPKGPLRHFDMIVNGLITRAAFRQGPGALARLSFYAAGAEFRYAVNTWLGVLGGYNVRYATFEGADAFPSLLRHVVFVGVSGFFTTDRIVPTLQTFVSPVTPPG
jgi:hypothetical protein